jgi:hypothetical protein
MFCSQSNRGAHLHGAGAQCGYTVRVHGADAQGKRLELSWWPDHPHHAPHEPRDLNHIFFSTARVWKKSGKSLNPPLGFSIIRKLGAK